MVDAMDVLQDLDRRMKTAFPDEVLEVILFGSQAKGTANEASDYDFVIVFKSPVTAELEEIYCDETYDTDVKFGICTDLLFISKEELNDWRGKQLVFQNAFKHGKRIAA